MGGAVTPGGRGVRGPTVVRGDRARTPQTLRKEVVQPRAGREGKGFRVSSPMATSPLPGVRESSALVGGATSPLPYRGYNMAAKHILDSGTPTPTGASMAAKWLQSSADRRDTSPVHGEGEWSVSQQVKKSRPGVLTVDVGQRRPDIKENLSPDSRSAPSKTLPVSTNAAKNILETQAATKINFRTVEVAKKTTQEMHDEMMQLFNEAKVPAACFADGALPRFAHGALLARCLCPFLPAVRADNSHLLGLPLCFQKTGCIIEVRSSSKCPSESPDKITLNKNYSRRKTKEEMHDEMMKLFEEAKVTNA